MMVSYNASSNRSYCCMNASAAGTSVRACMIMDIAALAMSIFCTLSLSLLALLITP